jgi:putative ABC transport system substrate-binding protein
VVEYRWTEGQFDRVPAQAAELVRLQVAVIVASGGSSAVAKAATTTIPIIFLMGDLDPITSGLVTSLNRPGGNVTGVMLFTSLLGAKRLELLHEMLPKAPVIGMLVNPNFPDTEIQLKEVQEAAHLLALQLHVVKASSEREFDAAFANLAQQRTGALLVGNDPFFNARRDQIVGLAARYALPTIYDRREYAAAGGLMSYGTSFIEAWRQVGIYAGRVLKGEKPADLPIVQPTKYELVINLKTAKALGLEPSPTFLLRADELLE